MISVLAEAELEFEGQLVQDALPSVSLYLPAAHAEHEPAEPVYPGLHEHTVAPAAEFSLVPHAVHVALLSAALYVPTAHSTHKSPEGV